MTIMGRVVLAGAAMMITFAAVAWVASGNPYQRVKPGDDRLEIVSIRPDEGEPEFPDPLETGSAIVTAAYGMDALQPASYDGALVIDLIDASHLGAAAKLRLSVNLAAAEAGRADLETVLSDVRAALALE